MARPPPFLTTYDLALAALGLGESAREFTLGSQTEGQEQWEMHPHQLALGLEASTLDTR